MKPTGDEVATAIKEWFYNEMKTGPAVRGDLGKFFFTAATATLGGIVAILSKFTNQKFGMYALAAVVLLLFASLFGILLASPLPTRVDGTFSILTEYTKLIRRVKIEIRVWTLLWLSGTVCGILAVVL